MSKPVKLEEKVINDNYQKFLFFLVQNNPFLSLYFRRHQPSDGFIYSILNTPNSEQGSIEVKNTLFNQLRTNTTDLDKITYMTKIIFGSNKIPGLVEDYLDSDWSSKELDLKGFLMFDSFNAVNRTNVESVLKTLESSFDRWFFCQVYLPRANALQLNDQIKIVMEREEQKSWTKLAEDLKSLVYLPPIHSPYPREHIKKYWPE